METIAKRLYEGLFLVDSALAASDWQGINNVIKKAIEKNDAEIVSLNKWDERKLAYEIEGKERGTYILCYFNAPPAKITLIEREVQLSELIMRVMILRTDRMPQEMIEKATPAMTAETRQKEQLEKAAIAVEEQAAAKAAEEAAAKAAAPEEEVISEESEAEEANDEETEEDEIKSDD